MGKKVLIFGYSGFVGPYLAKEFIANGYNVIGTDIVDPLDSNIEFYKSDLLCFEQVNELICKIQPNMIINLAAISSVGLSWKMPQKTIEVNVVGALNILEASRNLNTLPKVMFVGSSEEYAQSDKPLDENSKLDANNPYGISKFTQEKFAKLYKKQYGMKIYCVRSFNHTGVGQKDSFVLPSFCKQVAEIEKSKKAGVINVGNLSAFRDFSDVRDIVRAYRIIIESDDCDNIYNIGSGVAYSINRLLEIIISFSKQKIDINIDSNRYRPVDTPYICCDNSLLINTFNFKFDYNIEETLKEMYMNYIGVAND